MGTYGVQRGSRQPFAWAALRPTRETGSPRWPCTLTKTAATMFDRTQNTLARVDPDIWAAIQAENRRQEEHIELIASENYTSPAVMAAQGSQLTNKYAEGYPGKRYYVGAANLPDDGGYAGKVLSEQAHLRQVAAGKLVAVTVPQSGVILPARAALPAVEAAEPAAQADPAAPVAAAGEQLAMLR